MVTSIPLKQSSPSGLIIEVQFLNYDPNALFHKENFEYDDLVEFEYVFFFFFFKCPDPDRHD